MFGSANLSPFTVVALSIQPRDRQIKGAGHDMEESDYRPGVISQEGKCKCTRIII